MSLSGGGSDSKFCILAAPRTMQSCSEITWQERAVARCTEYPSDVRPMLRRPVEPGKNAGERTGKIGDAVRDDGQAECCKARGIAIGVEDQRVALRCDAIDDACQHAAAGDRAHRFVAAAHTPGEAAGKHEAKREIINGHRHKAAYDIRRRRDITRRNNRNSRVAATKLDLTGLKCPLPALMTRKAMKALAIGEYIEVHCTDPMAVIDIPVLVQQIGDRIDSSERSGDVMIFIIEKMNAAIANDD